MTKMENILGGGVMPVGDALKGTVKDLSGSRMI